MTCKGENTLFLLSFKFNGIKNIKEDLLINFYKDTVTNAFKSINYKIKGIYGENGVGKSAIITAMKIYKEIMINRRFFRNGVNDRKISYLVNKEKENASFETEYLLKKEDHITIYRFKLKIQKNPKNNLYEIVYESCEKRKPTSKYKLLYANIDGVLNMNVQKVFDEHAIDISKNLLKESSFLSVIFSDDLESFDKDVIDTIDDMVLCHLNTYIYMDDKDRHNDYISYQIVSEMMNKNDPIDHLSVTNSIDYLTCNNRILVKKENLDLFKKEIEEAERFIKVFKPDLLRIRTDLKEDRGNYVCELVFDYEDYSVNGEFESTGIKKLVELYTAFKKADDGQIVFIDELDANIHDFYLCKLLEYVAEYGKGQLCFTTHNLGPMRVLKKYKKSIDFLCRDGDLISWAKNGNYQVDSLYSKGLINKSPFNLEAFQFLEVFGE